MFTVFFHGAARDDDIVYVYVDEIHIGEDLCHGTLEDTAHGFQAVNSTVKAVLNVLPCEGKYSLVFVHQFKLCERILYVHSRIKTFLRKVAQDFTEARDREAIRNDELVKLPRVNANTYTSGVAFRILFNGCYYRQIP